MASMSTIQKLALNKFHSELLHDLDLNADLVGKFIHHGIFNEEMIEEFKGEKTRRKQVQKMLLQLPRRGPRAFDLFLHCLQQDYPWLAKGLRDKFHKLTQEKDPALVSLKDQVDMFVHETFGSSKRFCEEDKKNLRTFLYKFLKQNLHSQNHAPTLSNLPHASEHRRMSIDSTSVQDLEQNIENKILQQVLALMNKSVREGDDSDDSDDGSSNADCSDISFDMIESKVNEWNNKVENLECEIDQCYKALGLDNCQYALHEVLETYEEKRKSELAQFTQMKDKLDRLEKKRGKLEEKLYMKEQELQKQLSKLAISEHEHEKSKQLMRELQGKCERLEELHLKQVEKQQTLIHLKNMVNDLSPLHRERQSHSRLVFDEVDGPAGQHTEVIALPPLGNRSTTSSNMQHSRQTARQRATHHEIPGRIPRNGSGTPWK